MHTNTDSATITGQMTDGNADNANSWTSGASMRQLVLLPVLLVALSVAITAPASAQTTFRADVTSTQTRPAGPCTNGAYICGTNLAGYGAATWNVYITGYAPEYSACDSSYTATTYLTLVSNPASTLVLDEAGALCGLGQDGAAYRAYFVQGSQAFGHPFAIVGTWTVDAASTGQFAGLGGVRHRPDQPRRRTRRWQLHRRTRVLSARLHPKDRATRGLGERAVMRGSHPLRRDPDIRARVAVEAGLLLVIVSRSGGAPESSLSSLLSTTAVGAAAAESPARRRPSTRSRPVELAQSQVGVGVPGAIALVRHRAGPPPAHSRLSRRGSARGARCRREWDRPVGSRAGH